MIENNNINKMSSLLNPLCRGLVGYISYLASCRTSTVYSEYLLYEPILRIAKAQGWDVQCEVPVKVISNKSKGDHKRIDFIFKRDNEIFAMEVKWIKKANIQIQKDIDKLNIYHKQTGAPGYVLFFGLMKHFEIISSKKLGSSISLKNIVNWNAGKTNYAAAYTKIV